MFSLSSSAGPSVFTAGEAGIVLSRFFPSETPAVRCEEAKGLVVLDAGVVGALLFVGLSVLPRAVGFLSELGEG